MTFIDFVGWHWIAVLAVVLVIAVVISWRFEPSLFFVLVGAPLMLFFTAFGTDWMALQYAQARALEDVAEAKERQLALHDHTQSFLNRMQSPNSDSMSFNKLVGGYGHHLDNKLSREEFEAAEVELSECLDVDHESQTTVFRSYPVTRDEYLQQLEGLCSANGNG